MLSSTDRRKADDRGALAGTEAARSAGDPRVCDGGTNHNRAPFRGAPVCPCRQRENGGDECDAQIGERVQSALMGLTKEYREVVVLRYFGELSYEEIGETIGIPEKTVKSRLFSARQRLAEILSGNRSIA